MTLHRFVLIFLTLLGLFALLDWLGQGPNNGTTSRTSEQAERTPLRFRLGLIPDRNLYQQRQAFHALGQYLESHSRVRPATSTLDDPIALQIELVTSSNYAGILRDFANHDIDGAFLGSLVAVLAVDRSNAVILAKSQNRAGLDTYAGTLFVPQDSPITTLADLRGKKLAAVRTTMAGSIFPLFDFQEANIDSTAQPEFLWSGTHDDVIEEVLAHGADAGAVKDLRLDTWEREHPGSAFRRIATGPRAPDNAFVVSRDLSPDLRDALLATLLNMHKDPAAEPILQSLQVRRFLPCTLAEYTPLYDMIDAIVVRWRDTGIEGPPPKRPRSISAPATSTSVPAQGGR